MDIFNYYSTGELTIGPTLIAGDSFFELSDDERKAAVAHEIGHLCHYEKGYNTKRLTRIHNLNKQITRYYRKNCLSNIIFNMSKKNRQRIKSLEKWSLIFEIYADNHAANAGYGKPLLAILKDVYNQHYDKLKKADKRELTIRIENLEKILGEQNGKIGTSVKCQ